MFWVAVCCRQEIRDNKRLYADILLDIWHCGHFVLL
jgi:hypothetical protein